MTMEKIAIWDKLTQILREMFDNSRITVGPETTAHDVEGWDSLAHIQLLIVVEDAFGIRFNTGEVAGLANVGEMVELIARKKGSK